MNQEIKKKYLSSKEKKKYSERWKTLASQSEYFTLDLVKQIGLEYDILIVTGARNIGKTFQVYQLATTNKPGKKGVYIRYTDRMLKEAMEGFKQDSKCPFQIVGSVAYKKEKDEYGNTLPLTKEGRLPENSIMRFISFNNRHNVNSAFGSGYNFAVFDEFIPSKAKKETSIEIKDWLHFIISISRDEKDFKFYMFGNNLWESDFMMTLGLNREDPLEQLQLGNYKILYLNTKNYLKGQDTIAEQLLKGLDEELYEQYANNEVTNSVKIISNPEYVKAFHDQFKLGRDGVVWSLKSYEKIIEGIHFIVYLLYKLPRHQVWSEENVFTDDENMSNLYGWHYIGEMNMKPFINTVKQITTSGKLHMTSSDSYKEFMKLFYK